jgi:hypothetical protein
MDVKRFRLDKLCHEVHSRPMQQTFNIIILAALAIVTLTLFAGIYTLFRGGDFARSWSNKLMRLRVLTQAVAIALLVALMWWRGQPG